MKHGRVLTWLVLGLGFSLGGSLGCSGSDSKRTTTATGGGTAGSGEALGAAGGSAVSASTTPVDPQLAARRAFENPGGMWMPLQMSLPGHAEVFTKLGVQIDPKQLANPLAAPLHAIVRLNGCSASFVSPDGLVVTNHHCVQTALQINSKPERNLVETGFLAKTRADELPAGPAERVYVAEAFTDVTTEVRSGLDKIADPVARKDEAEQRIKTRIAACEKGRPGVRCNIATYFRSGMYVLIEELEIRDVRLVYVPARSVGNYGGEIDNWQWPRHTGDFSFYRAYVGKDGKPAAPSPDNVPYKPAHHLKVSTNGLRPDDFVMITGFPGRTTRTKTALEVKHDVEWYYPYFIELAKQRYAIAETHLASPGETAIKAGVMKQSVQNGLEKTSGVLKGLTAGDLLQRSSARPCSTRRLARGRRNPGASLRWPRSPSSSSSSSTSNARRAPTTTAIRRSAHPGCSMQRSA
jgi:hypothetical protein